MPDLKPPRLVGGERATLQALHRYQRESLVRKATGVDDASARRAAVGSGTSLLWLVKHCALAEQLWILRRFAGSDAPLPDDSVQPGDTVERAIDDYRATWVLVDDVVAGAALDDLCVDVGDESPVNLRWVLMHLLEETARHAATPTSCASCSTAGPDDDLRARAESVHDVGGRGSRRRTGLLRRRACSGVHAAVASGDWRRFVERFAVDATLEFVGPPVGPFVGRQAIAEAYERQPPDDVIEASEPAVEGSGEIVVPYRWARTGATGSMRITERGGAIVRLVVVFD